MNDAHVAQLAARADRLRLRCWLAGQFEDLRAVDDLQRVTLTVDGDDPAGDLRLRLLALELAGDVHLAVPADRRRQVGRWTVDALAAHLQTAAAPERLAEAIAARAGRHVTLTLADDELRGGEMDVRRRYARAVDDLAAGVAERARRAQGAETVTLRRSEQISCVPDRLALIELLEVELAELGAARALLFWRQATVSAAGVTPLR